MHLICIASEMTGFQMKWSTTLKQINPKILESHGNRDYFLEILSFFPARENMHKTKRKYLSFKEGIITTETAPLAIVKI